jgi:predicted transcriptional regulator YdeE
MNIDIRENLSYHLYGFSGPVPNFKFGETGIALSGKMWDIVKKNKLPNKGINIWVYDDQSRMFCGVELEPRPANNFGMEERDVHFKKYVWYKHVGPYQFLKEANEKIRQDMEKRGIKYGAPSLEIYGHHDPDPQKLETEIIYTVY